MVVERDDASEHTARRQAMQQTIGLKRFVVTHVGATALALTVLVSSGLAIAGLAATGNAPWMSGSASQVGAQQREVQSMHTAQEARFFEAKVVRQEELELQSSVLVAKVAAHEKLLRFYALKEEQLLALSSPSPTASTAARLAEYARYNPVVDGVGSSALGRLLAQYERYNPTVK
jgi:hypothetical protein